MRKHVENISKNRQLLAFPILTTYNASITHVFSLPWDQQKLLVGFDVISVLGQQYFYNMGREVSGSGWPMRGCPVHSFSVRNGFSKKMMEDYG